MQNSVKVARLLGHVLVESQENRQIRLLRRRSRQRELRFQPFTTRQWKQGAFHYDPKHDYAAKEVITIGSMSKVCNYCRAKNGIMNLLVCAVLTVKFNWQRFKNHHNL